MPLKLSMGYLDNFLGVSCWHCGTGHISLLDKGLGVHLVCTRYPNSCQFISVSPVECPKCSNGSLVIEHSENRRYLYHARCEFKSQLNDFELKFGKPSRKEKDEIQKVIDQGLLVDYLSTLSFDQLNQYWENKIWEDPFGIPLSENIDEEFIKISVQKVRSIKWKLENKTKNAK